MNLPDINALLPLIAAGFYTILLIVSLVRQSHHARALRWLLLLLVISLAWEFVIFFAATIPYPNLPLRVVVLNTAVLAMTTAVYLDWRPRQRWYILGIGALASIVVLDIVTPTLSIPDVPNLPISALAYGTLLAYLTWFALSGLMLLKSWRSYQNLISPGTQTDFYIGLSP